ncbi:hypothetical protein OH76DRAFT_95643 [Lentinus brumalis]|uniref:Uncharacterized protein n=1 Tax=Lentinus brumalis TaxID=2498619 RepID=A0A371CQI0_9APHY|nr:hypothetical protein OH76DRAFT_95643 [Polyporus brumalis]
MSLRATHLSEPGPDMPADDPFRCCKRPQKVSLTGLARTPCSPSTPPSLAAPQPTLTSWSGHVHLLRPTASSQCLHPPASLPRHVHVAHVQPRKLRRELLRQLPGDAHGPGVPPVRAAHPPAAHDLPATADVLQPLHAAAKTVLRRCLLR